MSDFDVGPYRTAAPVRLPGVIKPRVLGYHTSATFRLVLTKTGEIVHEQMGMDSLGMECWTRVAWPDTVRSIYNSHGQCKDAEKQMQAILKCLLEANP